MMDARAAYNTLLENVDSLVATVRSDVQKRAHALGAKTASSMDEISNTVLETVKASNAAAAGLRAELEKRADRRAEKVAMAVHILRTAMRLGS